MKGAILSVIYVFIYFQVAAQVLPSPPQYTDVNGNIVYGHTSDYVFMGRWDYDYWTPQKLLPLTPNKNIEGNFTFIKYIWPAEELTYKNGLLDGHFIHYWDNGNPQFEITVKEGLVQGSCREWYESGELFIETEVFQKEISDRNIFLTNNKDHAVFVNERGGTEFYFLNPRPGVLYELIQDEVERSIVGLYKCYWPNGNIMQKSFYLDGKQIGYAYYYDETGALTAFEYYGTEDYAISWGIKQPDGTIKGYTTDITDQGILSPSIIFSNEVL